MPINTLTKFLDDNKVKYVTIRHSIAYTAQQIAEGISRGTRVAEVMPATVTQEVVIDDFIRNFMQKFKMDKTLNIFHQEWHELQKKGTFHDVQIGLITDSKNKNDKLRAKIEKMKVELKEANVIAE